MLLNESVFDFACAWARARCHDLHRNGYHDYDKKIIIHESKSKAKTIEINSNHNGDLWTFDDFAMPDII